MPPLPTGPRGLEPGVELLGRYVLLERLGEGLGGETWKAAPIEPGPAVAIKVVGHGARPGGMVQGRIHEDLLREASFLREMRHPHIVPFRGIVDLPGADVTFLVTDFAEGGNLEHWVMRRGVPRAPLAARLVLQLVDALDAMHGAGVLHRDLKPQNVLVREPDAEVPHLLVADFGISRRMVGSAASLTRHMGTVGYGAPEIWTEATVGPPADVFSLGAIAWYLICGRHPIPEPGMIVADVDALEAGLTAGERAEAGDYLAVARRMMALQAADRPALAEVRATMAAVAEGRAPPVARHPTIVSEPGPPRGARRRRIGVAFALAGAFVAVAALVPATGERATAPDRQIAAVAPTPEPEPDPIPVPPPAAERRAVAVVAPAPTPATPPPIASEAPAPAVAPEPADAAPAPPEEAPGGPIGRLRVGLVAPSGLPAEAELAVTAAGGVSRAVANTQIAVEGARAGMLTVEVRTATRVLGRASLRVPAGDEVRVLCESADPELRLLRCAVR